MRKVPFLQLNSFLIKLTSIGCLAITALSCSQQYHLSLNDDINIGGAVTAKLQLKPLFTRYLQDLDIFSGFEKDDHELPSIIEDLLSQFSTQNPSYHQKVNYNSSNQSFTVDYNYSFDSINKLLTADDNFFNRLIEIRNDGFTQTIIVKFDAQTRREMQDRYPLLVPITGAISQERKASYLSEVATTLASSRLERPLAEDEINSSLISLTITAPRIIKQIEGGIIASGDPQTAVFKFNLLNILYPITPLYYKLVY